MDAMYKLPSEFPPTPNRSLGGGSGDRFVAGETGTIATLDPCVEFMRFCEHCGEERAFICAWFSLAGLIGKCLYCGTPGVAEYTRMNSEAA